MGHEQMGFSYWGQFVETPRQRILKDVFSPLQFHSTTVVVSKKKKKLI